MKANKRIDYKGLDGNIYSEELKEIKVSGKLLHATPDYNIEGIKKNGLKINMPATKLVVDISAIFCTIPSKKPTTNDLFRYYEDWSIVIVDTDKIPDHVWYIDFLAEIDSSNNGENQHIMTLANIPPEAIKQILK